MKGTRIQLVCSLLKGIKMDIPYSKYVIFSIGTAILLYSISHFLSEVLTTLKVVGLL